MVCVCVCVNKNDVFLVCLGHSTNTQAQSVTVQPWRSGGEPPLASIRPMSMQVRTIAVLPTSQTPSAVMVPPQQQVSKLAILCFINHIKKLYNRYFAVNICIVFTQHF